MKPFIYYVAEDLIRRLGTNLRDVTIIFPNKRAGLFLNQQFAEVTDKPVWAPKYRTISDIFQTLSPLTLCDDIMAVCELYQVYRKHVENPESLDVFYGWGEIMLSDFDDIDKHMADARSLFANVKDIKEMDDNLFLSENQIKALKRFFNGFSLEENSLLKQRFLDLWNVMFAIYADFNAQLSKKGMAYEGALYRDVIQRLHETRSETERKKYVIVGFNVLNEVEKNLFLYLKKSHDVLFYWDYDLYYTNDEVQHEAGEFIKRNLREFGNALPISCYDNMKQPKEIEYISTNSENVQARYIPEWLKDHITTPEQETAVVLCNESLLQPVLHSLPEKDEQGAPQHTNITMGFPFADTPVYSFLHAVLSLQTIGYDTERNSFRTSYIRLLRQHPFFTFLNQEKLFVYQENNSQLLEYLHGLLKQVASYFGKQEEEVEKDIYQQMYNEAVYKGYQVLQRFMKMEEDGMLDLERHTLKGLIVNVLKGLSIPFHGEPAYGLQIMGVLETRNLNFKNILMLSVNEGMMPKNANDSSFIPYHLKKAFGLTTLEHKMAVYAFYFYRLLQRAEKITFMYNTANGGTSKNEMSRFLRQLLAETDSEIHLRTIKLSQDIKKPVSLIVNKTPEIMRTLWENYTGHYANGNPRMLSPSALNAYIDCPMKFYFQQVAKLHVEKNPEDGLDAALFGTIFHESAERVYLSMMTRGNHIRKQDIEHILENEDTLIMPHVEAAFLKNFFDNEPKKVFYNGQLLVAKKVIARYIKQLLRNELKSIDLIVKDMEKPHFRVIEINSGNTVHSIQIGGKIDKMDYVKMADEASGQLTETLRIIDYKTGGKIKKPTNMYSLFTPDKDRANYVFQAFLYSWVMCAEEKRPISPLLFYVNHSSLPDYDPIVLFNGEQVKNFKPLADDFENELRKLLEEQIFNPELPFKQTETKGACTFCDYKLFCGK